MFDSPLVTIPCLAFTLALLAYSCTTRFFPRIGLLDFPKRYGLVRSPLPYPAGIAAVVTFLVVFPLLQAMNERSIGVMIAIALLGATCFIDDRRPLHPALRLVVQLACAFMIFLTGDCTGGRICSITNPLEGIVGGPVIDFNVGVPWMSFVVTAFWIMLTTNALNWFDGIPGQVNTLSTIGFATIGLLSLSDRVNQPEIALIAFTLAGIALAGMLFDFPPARVVLGDSGSMFFGLMLGILTVYAGGKVATAFLVLGVPMFDLAFVFIKRILEGRAPWHGSSTGEHLHHRLLARGFSPRSIIALTASTGALFGVTALFLDTLGKIIAGAILGCAMLIVWIAAGAKKSATH